MGTSSLRLALRLLLCVGALVVAGDAQAEDIEPADAPRSALPHLPVHIDSEAEEGFGYFLNHELVTGGYGAPELKWTSLAGDSVLLAGGEAGWILGHSVFVGGGGFTSITNVVSPPSLQAVGGSARLGMSYGGVRMGGILAADRPVHASFGLLIGGGRASSQAPNDTFQRNDDFLVIEPEVEAEANLGRHVRVALGGGFRFIGNTSQPGFAASRLSGPMGVLAFRLGEF